MLYTPERGGGGSAPTPIYNPQIFFMESACNRVQGPAGNCRVLQGTAGYCEILQSTAGYWGHIDSVCS